MSDKELCLCLLKNNCNVCKDGYHIFCNKIPHGIYEEAHRYFVENPDVANNVIMRDEVGKKILEGALAEINAKQ